MGTPASIGRRERDILTAIVESYISTGEPVGSRTLARANPESLSAASIRNVMADLADAGYLEQPHTSAGRIPTTKAYRFYVKQLTGEARLTPADESLIQGNLQGLSDVQEFMERTSRAFANLARGGRDGELRVGTAQCFGARIFPAFRRQKSSRGCHHHWWFGARSGFAARQGSVD